MASPSDDNECGGTHSATCAVAAAPSIRYVPETSSAAAQSVFEMLERWRTRCESHVTTGRQHHRYSLHRELALRALVADKHAVRSGDQILVELPVYSRNISLAGVGLLVAPLYFPELLSDTAQPIRADELVAVGRCVEVSVPQPDRSVRWLSGTIVRARSVHHRFVECGIQFTVAEHQKMTLASPPASVAREP